MSKVAISKEKIVAVADAIREKAETTEEMGLDAMPQAIRDIKSGGADFTIDNASYLFYDGVRWNERNELLSLCKDVTNMCSMFYNLNYYEIPLNNFPDTSKVTNMANMFRGCANIKTLDLSNFNTGKVTNMSYMFGTCNNLTTLDVSNFNTSNVTKMNYMFESCKNLKSLDVSNFNTGNVTDMTAMFSSCSGIESLDVSSFDTSKTTSMSSIFTNCSKLKEIIGFSSIGKAGIAIGFPFAYTASAQMALKRLTFRTDLPEGTYAIRSAINIQYCSFDREGMVEMFNSLPDISSLGLSSSYTKITIKGNPCVTDRTLTDEDRAIATGKGWTLVE